MEYVVWFLFVILSMICYVAASALAQLIEDLFGDGK